MSEYVSLHTLLSSGQDTLSNVEAVELAVAAAEVAGFATGIDAIEYVCGEGGTHRMVTARIGNLLILTGTGGEAGADGHIGLYRVPEGEMDEAFISASESMRSTVVAVGFAVI